MPRFALLALSLALAHAALSSPTFATDMPAYQTPPKAMVDLVDAPRQPSALVSPDKQFVAFVSAPSAPALSEVARAELKLAGTRINPATRAPSRALAMSQLQLRSLNSAANGGEARSIALPTDKFHAPRWSPDSKHLAIIVEEANALVPHVIEISTGKISRLNARMNAALGLSYQWARDSKALILPTVVGQAQAPAEGSLQAAPAIQVSGGKKSAVRTFQDMLKSPADEALFSFYAESQLSWVPLNGKPKALGAAAIHGSFSLSPDGKLLLVERIEKPFSYIVPWQAFPTVVDVRDLNGKILKEIARIPVQDKLPQGFDSVITGPRDHEWRADAAATLVYAEALDGGDMAKNVAMHDRLYQWSAPFTAAPTALLDLEMRYSGLTWGNDDVAMVSESRFKDRMLRTTRFSPRDPANTRKVFEERSQNDAYADPGRPQMKPGVFGSFVLDIRDNALLLSGMGASPKGNVPFLDRYDLASGQKQRLWQSADQAYERTVTVLDADTKQLLIVRESPTEQPNYHIKNLADGSMRAISHFPHPTPYFAQVKKEVVKYTRADGVELSGNLYLPPDYKPENGPLPVLMWAYPLEFKDAATAGQVKESPYEFIRISPNGPLAHLAQGFAVFDDPKMPIIGAGEALPNDTFREQLIAGAKAAVDVLVQRGIADPKRIAVGGHSYGAFMTANLLAHSDLFATGIARSGAYNRSLTPFGFQGEERNYWEAQKTYADMSPFNYADKINEPLLMIHGEEDNNSGTFPIQSQRLYAAMAGLGGNARLVMLPHEQHGYRARESLLHMLWEQYSWLEEKVKNRK